MWDADMEIRRTAWTVMASIAEQWRGQQIVLNFVRRVASDFSEEYGNFITRVAIEASVSLEDAFDVWKIITNLLKERIIDLLDSGLRIWLHIPQVNHFTFNVD